MGRHEADAIGELFRRWADSRPPEASEQLARLMGPLAPIQAPPGRAALRRVAGAGLGVKVFVAAGLLTATAAAAAVGAQQLAPSRAPRAPQAPLSDVASNPGNSDPAEVSTPGASHTGSHESSPGQATTREAPEPVRPSESEAADATSTPESSDGGTAAPDESSPASVPTDESADPGATETAQAPTSTDSANSSDSIAAAQN